MKRPLNRRGFMLLELMAATLLLVIGVASAVWCLSRGIFASRDSEATEQAVALVQEEVERLRATSYGSIASQPRAPVSGWPGYERQVVVTNVIDTELKQVVVRVYWRMTGGEVSSDITTYFANNAFIY